MNLLKVHVCLLKVRVGEVEERTLAENSRDGPVVQLAGLLQPLLAVVHVALLLQRLTALLQVTGRLVPDISVVTQTQQSLNHVGISSGGGGGDKMTD